MRLLPLFAILFAYCSSPTTPPPPAQDHSLLVFVGTYTQKLGHVNGKATGIYTAKLDTVTGSFSVIDSVTDISNPSFVTLSPDKKLLFAVGENGGKPEQPYGQVAAYRVGNGGKLTKINEVPSYGVAPCHVSTDRAGKYVFVANYVTGNVVSYAIQPNGGLSDSLSMHRHPGKEPWAHQTYPSPDNTILYAVDKGADGVFTYAIGPDGKLTPITKIPTQKGAGPRHLDFNPKNPREFAVIGENNSTITLYRLDEQGKAMALDSVSTLPGDFKGQNTCADIHYHPNGNFIYGSNRGHNSIVVLQNNLDGRLLVKGHVPSGGEIPRNFMITPDGKWMVTANQNSSTVQVYTIDAATGMPVAKGNPVPVATPVCLKF